MLDSYCISYFSSYQPRLLRGLFLHSSSTRAENVAYAREKPAKTSQQ